MVPALSHKVSRVSWYSGSCHASLPFAYGAFTLSGWPFLTILLKIEVTSAVLTPECTHSGLGSAGFARRYSRYRCFFLFLRLLRCFSSPGSLCNTMYSCCSDNFLRLPGFPIRISMSHSLFAARHGFSQLTTSFVGSWCQGIRPMLLLA